MKKLLILSTLFLFSIHCAFSQWQELNYNKVNFKCRFVNQQNTDTVLIVETGTNNQNSKYSFNGGASFTDFYSLPNAAWGTILHARFIASDTILYITSKGILKRSFTPSDLAEFVVVFEDYDSSKPLQTPMTHFYEKDSGIVVCSHVFKTFDGGKNWSLQGISEKYSTGGRSLCYLPDKQRLIGNRGFKLIESLNHGKNWGDLFTVRSIANELEWSIHSTSFINKDTGFLSLCEGFTIGTTKLYKTMDGGKNWDSVAWYNEYLKIKFFDDKIGFAIPRNEKTLLKTIDGGKTWNPEFTFQIINSELDNFFYFNDSSFYALNAGVVYKRSRLSLSIQAEDYINPSINVFPNPVTEKLTIFIRHELPKEVEIRLMDANGKSVYTTTSSHQVNEVDVSNLPPATYTLLINNSSYKSSFKVIIK
jgi:hypothetical protein